MKMEHGLRTLVLKLSLILFLFVLIPFAIAKTLKVDTLTDSLGGDMTMTTTSNIVLTASQDIDITATNVDASAASYVVVPRGAFNEARLRSDAATDTGIAIDHVTGAIFSIVNGSQKYAVYSNQIQFLDSAKFIKSPQSNTQLGLLFGEVGTANTGFHAENSDTHLYMTANGTDAMYLSPSQNVTLLDFIFNGETASTVPYLDANKKLTSSAVTPTELGYVSGVTSAIQTQLDAKLSSVDLTSDVTGVLPIANGGTNSSTALTGSYAAISNGTSLVEFTPVSTQELSYVDGVTSAIQTQIDSKQATMSGTANEIELTGATIGLADDAILPGSGAATLPSGATGARPGAPTAGMIRYNSTTSEFEGYTTSWGSIGGSVDLSGVTQNIIPATTDTYNIGNATTQWLGVYADNIQVSSTQNPSIPCPVMTTAQREALTVGASDDGSCVYDSDLDAQYSYSHDTTQWLIAGSIVDTENVSDWTSYTPTVSGLGTVSSVEFYYRQVGDSYEIQGELTAGTVAGTELQIGLPNSKSVATSVASVRVAGVYVSKQSSDTAPRHILITGGDTYLNVGKNDGSTLDGLTPTTGVNVTSTGQVISVFATVPIDGLTSSTRYALNNCDGLECINEFSAVIENTGAACNVLSENVDFIASCSRTGTGDITITWNTGVFTVAPAITCTNYDGSTNDTLCINLALASTTSVRMMTRNTDTSGAAVDSDFQIMVQRQGTDFFDTDKRFINVTGYNKTTGVTAPKLFSAAISPTGTVTNEVGNFINGNCTNATPQVCTFETGAFTTVANCTVMANTSTKSSFCTSNANITTSQIDIACTRHDAVNTTTTYDKYIICHGY